MQDIHPNRKDPKMRKRWLRLALPASTLVVLVGALSSCGGGGGTSTSAVSSQIPSEFQAVTSAPSDAKSGGHLTVLAEGDIDYMDPGEAYYQFTYQMDFA